MNIDIIRIFAFAFIVMLHTLNRQYGLTVWMSGYAVISIGVNLFIMISGYLLLDRTETVKEFFRKRFFSILPLFIIFNIIYIFKNIHVSYPHNFLFLNIKFIAYTPYGLYIPGFMFIVIKFCTKSLYMGIDRSAVTEIIISPDRVQKIFPCKNLIPIS